MVGPGGVRKTWELRLADLLGDVGPFVTIGDPTETLPRVGAARLYVGDDAWHQTVEDVLGRGGTIILHAATRRASTGRSSGSWLLTSPSG